MARRLGLSFIDSDSEIEETVGLPWGELFERYGEEDYRDGERRLVARLVDGEVRVIATGDLHAGWETSFGADRSLDDEPARDPA